MISKRVIKSIRKVDSRSRLYDIETANNHNFFANGILVHNSSGTFYCRKIDGEWQTGVCSRSLEMKKECVNNYTRIEKKYDILRKLKEYCVQHDVSLALRGEVYGQGIQSSKNNPHSQVPLDFAAFSVYNMDTLEYEHTGPHNFVSVSEALGIPHVDIIEEAPLTPELIKKYAEDISEVNGKPFEGVVVKCSNLSFKIINLNYDEKK